MENMQISKLEPNMIFVFPTGNCNIMW